MDDFQRWCDRARARSVGGRFLEAEAAFREALRRRPGDARVTAELAVVLRRLRRPQEAESLLREALAQAPAIATTHAELGSALFEQDRFAESERAYREAVRLRPDFAKAHLALGLALERQGDFLGAAGSLQEAVRLKAGNSLASVNLARVLRRLRRPADAEAVARDALSASSDPALRLELAGALLEQGRHGEAAETFRA